jgi:ribonuclease III
LLKGFSFLRLFFSPNKKLLTTIKNLFGFYPGNINLYQKALKHRSVAAGDVHDSNERLEYLGDAVYGAIITDFLFVKFPFKDEGYLTQIRSRMVSRAFLNGLAIKLGINKLIVLGRDSSKGKSIYGDAFEALIGAIYLDKGYDFTKNIVLNRILKYHLDFEVLLSTETDYKSKLINWAQKEKKELAFEVMEESGLAHDRIYQIAVLIDGERTGIGTDNSKKKAEQQASKEAIEKLGFN